MRKTIIYEEYRQKNDRNLFPAVLAGSKGLYTKVYPHVLRQVRAIRKRFDAMSTFVWLRLSHVHLTVYLVHFRFGVEALE